MTAAETLVRTVLQAWGEANLGPVREALDENIVWKSGAKQNDGTNAFSGCHKGKADVTAHMAKLSTRYFFQSYVAKEIISQGDIVWGLFEAHGHYVPPGGRVGDRKPISFESAVRCKVRGDKIVELQTFFDTAGLFWQQGELYGARASLVPARPEANPR